MGEYLGFQNDSKTILQARLHPLSRVLPQSRLMSADMKQVLGPCGWLPPFFPVIITVKPCETQTSPEVGADVRQSQGDL